MSNITMFSVESSTISAIGYDADQKELHIIFLNNYQYVYRGFPADLWQQFKDSESKGRFFAANIKKQFHGERLS